MSQRIAQVSCSLFAAALFFLPAKHANGQMAAAVAPQQTSPLVLSALPTQNAVEALRQQLARALQLVKELRNQQHATEAKLKETQSALNAQSKERAALEAKLSRLEQALATERRNLQTTQAKLDKLQSERKAPSAPAPRPTPAPTPSASGPTWTAALFGGLGVVALGGMLGLGMGFKLARMPRWAKPFMPTPHFKASVESSASLPDWTIALAGDNGAAESMRSLGLRGRLEIGDVDAPSSVRVVEEERDERA